MKARSDRPIYRPRPQLDGDRAVAQRTIDPKILRLLSQCRRSSPLPVREVRHVAA